MKLWQNFRRLGAMFVAFLFSQATRKVIKCAALIWTVSFMYALFFGDVEPVWWLKVAIGPWTISQVSSDGKFVAVTYTDEVRTSGNAMQSGIAVWDLERRICLARFPNSLAYNRTRNPFGFSSDSRYFSATLVRARLGNDPGQLPPSHIAIVGTMTGTIDDFDLWPGIETAVREPFEQWEKYSVTPILNGTRVWFEGYLHHDAWQLLIDPRSQQTLWEERATFNQANVQWQATLDGRHTAFSQNGRFAASITVGEIDRRVSLVDLRSSHRHHTFTISGESRQPTLVFSPNSDMLAIGGDLDSPRSQATLEFYDVATHQLLGRIPDEGSLVFSQDGRTFATIRERGENEHSIQIVIRRTANLEELSNTRIRGDRFVGWATTTNPKQPFLAMVEGNSRIFGPTDFYGVFDGLTGKQVPLPHFLPSVVERWSRLLPDGRSWISHELDGSLCKYSYDGPINYWARMWLATQLMFWAAPAAILGFSVRAWLPGIWNTIANSLIRVGAFFMTRRGGDSNNR